MTITGPYWCQHWFRKWFGSIRQQAITQTSVVAILCHQATMSEVTVILSMANQLNLECFLDRTANPYHVGLWCDFRNSVTYWQCVIMTTCQARFLVINKCDGGANWMTSWHWNAFCITDPFMKRNHRWQADSHHNGSIMRSFCVCIGVSQNKLLNKESTGPWFETLWRQCQCIDYLSFSKCCKAWMG